IGRAAGREGPYGPDIIFSGALGKKRNIALGVGDKALCRIDKGADGLWRAKAIKKLDNRPDASIVGVFEANRYGGRVIPASRKDKRDYVIEKADAQDAKDGDLVRIRMKSSRVHGPKRAIVTEVIGQAGDPRAASIIALHTYDVPDEFAPNIEVEAETAIAPDAPREDLTQIPLITIDPADARDHDDAVYAEAEGAGWRVIVAIADVASHVPSGSALDVEAYRRGNSTYFPDRVAPMLPETLSADKCSLKEGELRETLAVEMTFSSDGNKTGHRFIRGRMRSAAKLSYTQAQAAIDGKPDNASGPLLETVLKPLWAAYAAIGKARERRSPLELDLPERRVVISDDGKVEGVALRERFDAHKLIEEFMIQANVCAAETLEEKRSPLIYRVHEEPSDEKTAALGVFLPTIG
ncbi:MAG: RNB domain-containing ribonuclease, partial [Pseudomonadota bacterium]